MLDGKFWKGWKTSGSGKGLGTRILSDYIKRIRKEGIKSYLVSGWFTIVSLVKLMDISETLSLVLMIIIFVFIVSVTIYSALN